MVFKKLQSYESVWYAIARILAGFMFFQHGAAKLFGIFGGKSMTPLMSLMGVVGFFEFAIGLAIMLGLFTRLAAWGGALLALVIFFKAHFSFANMLPIMNKGELILCFQLLFIWFGLKGNGKWSLENKIWKKEMF